jgi:3D (Asp-Asp-Asp) domain-containing protein
MGDRCARRVALWLGTGLAAFGLSVSAALVSDVPALAVVEAGTPELTDDEREAKMIEAVTALVNAAPDGAAGQGPVVVADEQIRWFNGRAMRPARTVTMRVTAYSPDAQSCGEFADGLTATMHPVTTNRGMLVAADQRMFPYGSLLSIPGYDEGRIVPVLDCGGAIKGNRLDVLFPTHEAALEWGVKELEVVVWEAVDGLALDDPREIR